LGLGRSLLVGSSKILCPHLNGMKLGIGQNLGLDVDLTWTRVHIIGAGSGH